MNPDHDRAPMTNDAEIEASIDYETEKAGTGRDPIPRERPDWAKDLPSPNESKKSKH